MAPDINTYFFSQGILGVLVIVLSAVCIKLYTKLQQVQESRLTDYKDTAKEVTTVLQNNTQSNLLLAGKIEDAKRGTT